MDETETDSELSSLIKDLVDIETENPPGNEEECSKYISNWFEQRNIDAELIRKPYSNRPQVGVQIGDNDPTLILNGHIDVVPAGNIDHWDHDPYDANIVDERLYGRGSVDMKTGIAIGMMTIATLADEIRSGDLNGSLVFQAAIGEETAEPGTRTLLSEGYDGDYGVVLEPTEMRTATSEKGLAWYEITVSGEPSHASRPDQGKNAIQHAQPVISALDDYDKEVRSRKDDLVGQAYSTVTEFQAGTKENVVPEQAVITVDRRFLPSEEVDDIDSEIDNILREVSDTHSADITWERTRTYESAAIEVDSSLAKTFRDHSAAIADVATEPWGINASTDVRNLVNDANIEAITWGPGDISQAHTYNEHIDLSHATDALHVLSDAAREVLSSNDN